MNIKHVLSRESAVKIDTLAMEQYMMPGVILMENAARGVAEYIASILDNGKVVICCGKGNNGGDGLAAARHLSNLGFAVSILLFAEAAELSSDAHTNFKIIEKMQTPITFITENVIDDIDSHVQDADLIIDALFGIGLQGKLSSFFCKVIDKINAANAQVLACDVPSGLDCDTGFVLGKVVQADYTCSMIGIKRGFLNPKARVYLGKVEVIDIGVPRKLLAEFSE